MFEDIIEWALESCLEDKVFKQGLERALACRRLDTTKTFILESMIVPGVSRSCKLRALTVVTFKTFHAQVLTMADVEKMSDKSIKHLAQLRKDLPGRSSKYLHLDSLYCNHLAGLLLLKITRSSLH